MNQNKKLSKSYEETEVESKTTKNGKRPLKKRKGRRSYNGKDNSRKAAESSTNDPAWYAQSPELLRDSSSIPFSWATGTPISRNYTSMFVNKTMPGVVTIELKQVLGETKSRHDPANVAADAIYSFVRHANSGHSNYDAPDLMMYLLGMSSIYSFITWCQRLLGLVMTYDQRNRYLPDVLIRANQVDPVDLRANIANFRFWLNTFISKVTSFAVPNVMPYFSRMAFLYSNYYIDGPSIKDQFYMYVPSQLTFLKFSIATSTSLGFLQEDPMVATPEGIINVGTIMQYGEELFTAMWSQEDFGIMSGDILKAYGSNIIKLAPVPEMFILQPVYDPMFLHQFKNAKCFTANQVFVGDIAVNENGYITQQVRLNQDLATQILKAITMRFGMEQILSTDFEEPTPEVVIESTRLMPTVINDPTTDYRSIACGSEIPLNVNFWVNQTGDQPKHLRYGGLLYFMTTTTEPPTIQTLRADMEAVDAASKFKYCPELDFSFGELSVTTGFLNDNMSMMWDVDNYAVLNSDDLQKMHQAALMSMLAVPSIGKIQ